MTTKKQLINLTPHAINILDEDNNLIMSVDPDGRVARVTVSRENTGLINVGGHIIQLSQTVISDEITDLPDPEDNVILIVSSMVANACPQRQDVRIPDDAVRDEAGRIIGCRSLGHV